LNCGISGPVVVDVVPGSGPYTERFLLSEIGGSSLTNTVTINGNGETLQFNGTNTTPQIIILDGTKHLTIDGLHIKSLNSTYGWGVAIAGGAKYDTIRNCHIDLATITGTGSVNSNGITISGSTASPTTAGTNSNLYIANNLIDGGHPTTNGGAYYGITAYGQNSTTFGVDSIWIVNNEIKNYYYMGIYAYYANEIHLIGNNLHRPLKTGTTTIYGIYTYYTGRSSIKNNRVHDMHSPTLAHTSTVYAMYLNSPSSAIPKGRFDVVNNAIYNMGTSGTAYFLYVYGGDSSYVAHNTVHINNMGTSTNTQYGIYVFRAANNSTLKNNNVVWTGGNAGPKYGIYCGDGSMFNTNLALQNNNVYMNSSQPGTQNRIYYGTAYATLAAFRAAFPLLETAGMEAEPQYLNYAAGDLTPMNPLVLMKGENLTAIVDKDIKNSIRPNPPTLGAFDLSPQEYNNAGVDSLLSPGLAYCAGQRNIRVRVRNYGINNIDTIQIHWSINGINQPPVTHTTKIDGTHTSPNNTANITLGQYLLIYGRSYALKAWTYNPNNKSDNYNVDDTLYATLSPTSALPLNWGGRHYYL
jgi:hypothetical protein